MPVLNIDLMEQTNNNICWYCKKNLNKWNESRWEVFTEYGKTAKICKDCENDSTVEKEDN